ncbi:MAG: hypothetical protein KatS3mg016_2255 [Fimbriimonadales bacterium]|nr:MAG: hypothetical protein KatS3mg016_2255 [Fimbriimonadales bacterium]
MRHSLGVIGLSALMTIAWSQTLHTTPHGEGMRGLSPATRPATPNIRWQKQLPLGIGHGSITFSHGGQFLYFKTFGAAQGQVFKVNAADGSTVWATDPTQLGFGNFSYTGVTVDEAAGRVYTSARASAQPTGQSFIAALDINTGATIWIKTASDLGLAGADFGRGNVLLSPDRTRLYVRDNANPSRIVALNAANGNLLWIYTSPFSGAPPFQTVGPVWTDPVSGRTRIAFSNNAVNGSVVVIEDAGTTANLVWSADVALGLNYRWWGNLVASLDFSTLYANSFWDAGNPVMTALRASDGQILWQIFYSVFNGMNQYQNPVVGGDGTIYSGGRVTIPPPIMSGAAATGQAGDFWNSLAASDAVSRPWTLQNLRAHDDSPTTIDIENIDFAESSTYPASDGDNLMRDYHYIGALGYNGPATIRLLEVPAGTYDLYLYSFTPIANDQNAVFTVNGETKTVTPNPPGPFTGYEEDVNYVVYRDISPVNGEINITVEIDLFNQYAVVNGLQLVGKTGALANKRVNVDFNQLGQQGGGITAIRPDGTIRWQFKPEGSGEFSGWPVVTCGRVIYACDQVTFDQTYLYAVRDNGNDASFLWRFQLPYSYFGNNSPSVGPDGTVYIAASRDNADPQTLYAFAPAPEGDINADGCIDDADLLAVLFNFGAAGCLPEDVNADGIVDDADLLAVLFNFGTGC